MNPSLDYLRDAKKLKDIGAKVFITETDGPKLLDNEINMGFIVGVKCESVIPDGFLKEGVNNFLDKQIKDHV